MPKWRFFKSGPKMPLILPCPLAYNISLINYFKKKPSSGPNLIAKTTIYTICCFKNVGVPGTPHSGCVNENKIVNRDNNMTDIR